MEQLFSRRPSQSLYSPTVHCDSGSRVTMDVAKHSSLTGRPYFPSFLPLFPKREFYKICFVQLTGLKFNSCETNLASKVLFVHEGIADKSQLMMWPPWVLASALRHQEEASPASFPSWLFAPTSHILRQEHRSPVLHSICCMLKLKSRLNLHLLSNSLKGIDSVSDKRLNKLFENCRWK